MVFMFSSNLNAETKRGWELKNYQTARINTRDEEDSAYVTRLAIAHGYNLMEEYDIKLEYQAFGETRYLWDQEEWQRSELGMEFGFRFLKDWVYLGESVHYAWLKNTGDTFELETRLEVDIPIKLTEEYTITLALLEEYTYATKESKATRNEIAGLFYIPVYKWLELQAGWRHIDRIHDYDSDQVELTAVLKY